MKTPLPERLSMIEDFMYTEPKEWQKKIRTEIQHLRQAHSKAMKKNNRITSGLLDLEPAIEKRRTAALLSSLEKLNEHDRQLAGDWITLNIFSESYAPVQYDGHILTAASIWILDRLSELNAPLDKIYMLLPTDEELIDDLFEIDIWDCQYEEDLIASVEYVLRYRNQDIAPLESNGGDGERILTSNLAAEGKDHADVPSRQKFEALVALLPQWMKDEAIAHFEACHQAWTERFFTGIGYYQGQYLDKVHNANTIRKEINEIRDKLERKTKQFMAERERLRKSRKAQIKSKPNAPVNALLMNPLKAPDLPIISQTAPAYVPSPLTDLINGSDSMRDAEIVSLLDRMKELDDLHEAVLKELDDVIDKRGKFLYMIVHRGYLTSDFVNEYFPEELHEAMLKPIPVHSPYEMCFAMLYAVEIGSDIPWLYGSCIGMLSEVIDYLPWGMSDYSELEDPYWEEVPPMSSKTPDFPDWYARDYCWKSDDEYEARNLGKH